MDPSYFAHSDSSFCAISFNQDCTSLCVGYQDGFKLINLQTLISDPRSTTGCCGDALTIVERLYTSNVIAYVSINSPRKLKFHHIKKDEQICAPKSYSDVILGVKLSRKRIVVLLERAIHIHCGLTNKFMAAVTRVKIESSNGLCALSTGDGKTLFAIPDGNDPGKLALYDAMDGSLELRFVAHENPLAAIVLNNDGDMVATASDKGTLIRVHSTSDGTCMYELRRGLTRCANIYSLSFSNNSTLLCASSSTETVHIFKLEAQQTMAPEDEGWISYLARQSEEYLPISISKMLNQWRAFAYASLPAQDTRSKAAITVINDKNFLVVASYTGFIYIYDMNLDTGGLCDLQYQFKIDELCDH